MRVVVVMVMVRVVIERTVMVIVRVAVEGMTQAGAELEGSRGGNSPPPPLYIFLSFRFLVFALYMFLLVSD